MFLLVVFWRSYFQMVGLCLILMVFICLSSWVPFLSPDILAFSLHEKCLQFSSFQSETADIYKALVCGHRLPKGLIKETFVKSGLIHLMVVSGAHLLFLERLWKSINLPFFRTGGILFLLILYALTANLHPPVLRALFSFLPPARLRGFSPGHFSFNIHGGRCETCKGRGAIKLEMRFLPDVWIPCEVCQGERYHRDILNIRYKGKNISDVLKVTVDEAVLFFRNHSVIYDKLKFLQDVGLGYVALGQSSATLSGGEAQRIKLSRELSRKSSVRTFYVLDEPTTGLHFHDIRRLIELMRRLSEKGHTVVVIEHNLDVLKSCDYVLDLGPEGGEKGGRITAEGPPSALAKNPKSVTGKYLKKVLQKPVGRG